MNTNLSAARAPNPLEIRGAITEAAAEWIEWKEEFEIFLDAAELSEIPSARKVAILRHLLGEDANSLFQTFFFAPAVDGLPAENAKDYDTVIKKFDAQFKIHLRCGRFRARQYFESKMKRGKNQPFYSWLSDVRNAALKCQYPKTEHDSRIRGILIHHCRDADILDKLMDVNFDDLTLQKTIDIISTQEAQKKRTAERSGISRIDAISNKTHKIPKKCYRCGTSHVPDKKSCPAYNKMCSYCKIMGHLPAVCRYRIACVAETD